MATNKCALNINFIYKTQFLWSTNSPSMKIENVTNTFEGSRIIFNNLIHACVFFDTWIVSGVKLEGFNCNIHQTNDS